MAARKPAGARPAPGGAPGAPGAGKPASGLPTGATGTAGAGPDTGREAPGASDGGLRNEITATLRAIAADRNAPAGARVSAARTLAEMIGALRVSVSADTPDRRAVAELTEAELDALINARSSQDTSRDA